MFRITSFISLFIAVLSISSPAAAEEEEFYLKRNGVLVQVLGNLSSQEEKNHKEVLIDLGWSIYKSRPANIPPADFFCQLDMTQGVHRPISSCFFDYYGTEIKVNSGAVLERSILYTQLVLSKLTR